MSDEQKPKDAPAAPAPSSEPSEKDLRRLQFLQNCVDMVSGSAKHLNGHLIAGVAVNLENGGGIAAQGYIMAPGVVAVALLLSIAEELPPADFRSLLMALQHEPRFEKHRAAQPAAVVPISSKYGPN